MRTTINNQRGIALLTALLLTLISLLIISGLLYLVLQGTKLSAASKNYKTVLQASHGGVDVFAKDLLPYVFRNMSSTTKLTKLESLYGDINLNAHYVSNKCFNEKLTSQNSSTAWVDCTADQRSADVNKVKAAPDMTFKLKGLPLQPGYMVYSKIVDTSPGNTDPSAIGANAKQFGDDSTGLIEGLGAAYNPAGGGGGVNLQHIPAIYSIEVQGERDANPQEKARLSVLYAY